MANINSLKTNDGKKIWLYRANTENADLSSTQYLPETQFNIGINAITPTVDDTDLTLKVPIGNGTVNDNGDNTMTGSSGGTNTTDNTTVYKDGAGTTDVVAQNLIANSTNVNKLWSIANLATYGTVITTTKYCGFWLYILDTTTLAKFKTSGVAVQLRLGQDASNYYYYDWTASELSVGWNWLASTSIISSWDTVLSPAGTIDYFSILIVTNNATDTFVAGDVVYDLLRTWDESDYYKDFVTGYPILDFTTLEVTQRCYLTTVEANGFNLNNVGTVNEDTTRLQGGISAHTDLSKSSTDEVAYIFVDRII